MKVLFYNDPQQGFGGAETYWHETTQLLELYGIEVLQFSPKIDAVPSNFVCKNFISNPLVISQFKAAIQAFQPDIIHLNKNYLIAKSIAMALRSFSIPVIATAHDYYTIPFPINFRNRLKKSIYPHRYCADEYIIPSLHYFKLLQQKRVRNIHYIPHFLDIGKWPYNEFYQESNKKLLYVGRLEKLKGVAELIRAFGILAKKDSEIHLTIIGHGNEEAKLQNFVKTEKLTNQVTFAGPMAQFEILKHCHRSTLLVVPTINNELFGLVGVEAQACGLPVVASDLPGIREWCLHGKTGITVPPGDPNALAGAIERLLANPTLRPKLRHRARVFVEQHYSVNNALPKLINLYGKIAKYDPHKVVGEIPQTQGIGL